MPSFLTGWQRTTGGKRRSVSMLEKKRTTPETLRLSAQGHHPSTGSVWRFHMVIISSTSIPVWSKETAIYCSETDNQSSSVNAQNTSPKHENKQTILICALHEAGRVWTERESYTLACITMVERFMQVRLWVSLQHLRHGTCGVFQVLSVRKNEWLKRCCFLWRVMSKDKLYEKLKKKKV